MTEEEFWAALAPIEFPKQATYRLYYDDQGYPLFYSMEAVAGNYIELDVETWKNTNVAQVVDGKIIRHKAPTVPKLIPSQFGTSCDPTDVTIVANETEPHIKWSLK